MSISLRLRIALILAAIVPLTVVGAWSLYTLHQTTSVTIEHSEAALKELGEEAILKVAQATANQIELYLALHPELDPNDFAQLQNDPELVQLARQPVGQTGYTAVSDQEGVVHFHADPNMIGVNMKTLADELPDFWAIFAKALDGSPSDGYYDWKDADGQIRSKYMSIVPVEDTPLRVAATTYIDEFSQPINQVKSQLADTERTTLIRLSLTLAGVALVAAVGASYLGRQFSRPIRQIADAASRVAAGDLTSLQMEKREDEIGTLAQAFNLMTSRLKKVIQRLEARNKETSQHVVELERSNRQNQRRAAQMQASAQVARAAASVLDPEELLNRVAHLISDLFGHYHTGIFLLDETGHWAVLQAANSEGGQRMLARGHRLAVGTQGIVGYVTNTGQARIAHNVGADMIHFDNPDLPETRCEMALPLIARDQIIGALDVQSTQMDAFGEEDMAVLGMLADQVAVALDNARLYKASQAALAQVQAVQRQYAQEIWGEQAARHQLDFLEYAASDTESKDTDLPEANRVLAEGSVAATPGDNGHPPTVAAPIKLRGQIIGALGLQDSETAQGRQWSPDEIALIETVADQVAQAIEAAQLFDETQRRAQQEQLVTEITGKIRSAPDIDSILRITVQEIRRVLGVSHGVIRLGTETHLRPPASPAPPDKSGDKTPETAQGDQVDD